MLHGPNEVAAASLFDRRHHQWSTTPVLFYGTTFARIAALEPNPDNVHGNPASQQACLPANKLAGMPVIFLRNQKILWG